MLNNTASNMLLIIKKLLYIGNNLSADNIIIGNNSLNTIRSKFAHGDFV